MLNRRHVARDAQNEYDGLPLQAVMVKWVDSVHPKSSWSWLDDDELPGVVVCYSAAWLVDESEDEIRITLSQSVNDNGYCQISGVMAIPRPAVVSLKHLA